MKTIKSIRKFIIPALLFFMEAIAAQTQFTVKHYSLNDGLSHNIIQNIVQDSKGFIWLSTWNGIEKFDGYSFRNFKSYPGDKIKLGNNRINSIQVSACDNIWIWTYDRLAYLLNTKTEQLEDVFSNNEAPRSIREIRPLKKGITWIIADNGDFYRINEHNSEVPLSIQLFKKSADPYIGDVLNAVFQDADNDEWLLTNKGISIVGKKKFRSSKVYEYIIEINKVIYLASANGEIDIYTPDGQIQPLTLPGRIKNIIELKKLSKEKMAIVSPTGITIFDTSDKSSRSLQFNESDGTIAANNLFEDSKGFLWVVTSKEKIFRYNTASDICQTLPYPDLSQITTTNSLAHFFHEDEYGCVWALLKEGVFCFYNTTSGNMELAYTEKAGEKVVYSISTKNLKNYFIDNQKNIWLNPKEGFDHLSFKKKEHERTFTSKNQEVRGLTEDHAGRIWMGIKNNKLQLYDTNYQYIGNLTPKGKIVKDDNVVFGAAIYCFFEDKENNIWIGSKDKGLFILHPETPLSYRVDQYLHDEDNKFSISTNSI